MTTNDFHKRELVIFKHQSHATNKVSLPEMW